MTSKVLPLEDAIERFVPEGCALLAVGGMHMHNNPMSLVREIVRRRRRIRRLLTSPSGGLNADLLIGAGLVEEVVTAYIGFEHLGLAPCFRRAVEAGEVRVLESDEASISHGLYAGAGGLPFIPLPAGLELADVARANPESYRAVRDPFSGAMHIGVAPFRPDVALLHALESDREGNVWFGGSEFTDRLMALASGTVLVQVERVVDMADGGRSPSTAIPGFLVSAVIESPGGCHPTASHGAYAYDDQALRDYLQQARTREGFETYVPDGLGSSEAVYQSKAAARIAALRVAPKEVVRA